MKKGISLKLEAKNSTIILLTIFFLSLTPNRVLLAQSLPDSSATWTIAHISMGSYYQNNSYQVQYDTLIQDNSFKTIFFTADSVFNLSNSSYHSAVREVEDKWYFIPENENQEYLLYDFDVTIEDTIPINNPWEDGRRDLIVFSKDSIELNDGFHKTFDVGIYDGPSGQPHVIDTWIKGIGSKNGLFYSGFFLFDIGFRLLCFREGQDLVYLNSPNGSCGYIHVGVKKNNTSKLISIYPNPIKNQLHIDSNGSSLTLR